MISGKAIGAKHATQAMRWILAAPLRGARCGSRAVAGGEYLVFIEHGAILIF